MISSAVFARYARSLVDVVLENHEEADVAAQLSTYRAIFKAVPDVLEAFHSPAVPRESKEKLLASLTAKYPAGRTTANFLRILLDHNRIRYFEEIYLAYVRAVNDRKGDVAARVTAAHDLSAEAVSRLREALAAATGRTVTLEVRTDAGLLGGLVVHVGSTVYDGSVRSQLEEMKRRLAEA
jgi:F-type H+-transporting ATPase subunit delta